MFVPHLWSSRQAPDQPLDCRAVLAHERLLFGVATLGGILHAIDEVFFAEEAYRAIPVAILSGAALVFYPRLSATVRGIAALAFGLFWLGGVFTHWAPMIDDGPGEGDWTSLASVPAGLLFVGLGIAVLADARRARPA